MVVKFISCPLIQSVAEFDFSAGSLNSHSVSGDDEKEFNELESNAAELNLYINFVHPYISWERGLNKNTNGLIRQYFPKKSDMVNVDQLTILDVKKNTTIVL